MSGSKIIDGLKEAVAGNTRRLHVDGQTWVRLDAYEELMAALGHIRGYLLNAKIDLETNTRKATAIATIEGGIKLVDDTWAKARVA